MRMFRLLRISAAFAACLMLAASALAQPPAAAAQTPDAQALRNEIAQLRREFEQRMSALESRLAVVEGGQPAAAAAAAPAQPPPGAAQPPAGAAPTAQVPSGAEGGGGPAGALPVYGNASAASKVFNPDMAVIGNFLGAAGTNEVRPEPALQLPESEVSFQAIVDPYARADFFMSFGEQGVNVEEGFVTFPTLPGGLLMKVGKQRAAFGKVNTLHTHVLPWADRPLVAQNLLNGEDGINDAGISLARLIPNPWLFLEATGQVYRGDSGEVFQSSTRSDLSYVAHLRGYHDITESTNVDIGGSFAHGHHNLYATAGGPATGGSLSGPVGSDAVVLTAPDLTTQLYGVDATVRWRPLQRSIYRSFIGRSEVIWSHREAFSGHENASGFYVSGDYQVGRRWFAGARLDRSGRLDNASLTDQGASLLVTYWPSEFSQVRGQLRRTKYAEGSTANEFLFQFQFAIGAHGAHPF
jgi:hypothetical protein